MTLNLNLQRSVIFFIIHINGECVNLPYPLPKEAVATVPSSEGTWFVSGSAAQAPVGN